MRHRKKINHLSRKSAHRKAMLSNMAASLILHKRINTTLAKAKALRIYIEPLITKSKEDTTHSRRIVFSHLQNKEAVAELFRDISVKVAERPGGYTRIIKTGTRLGDSAEMCMMELVDYNENLLGTREAAKEKSGRKRRAPKKAAVIAAEPKAKEIEETTIVSKEDSGSEVAVSEDQVVEASETITEDAVITAEPAIESVDASEMPVAETTSQPIDEPTIPDDEVQPGKTSDEEEIK